jgi:hypothetical protein
MTGHEDFNRPAFDRCERWLMGEGVVPTSPAHLNEVIGDLAGHERFLRLGIRMLLACDWIVLLPGWAQSKGACLELEVADACGLEVFEWIEDEEDEPYLRPLVAVKHG